jgi:hypothetical protein
MSLFPRAAESALANIPRSKGSKIFVVDYVNGSDSNPGTKWDAPLKTVEAAYALCTTLKNDTVLLVGNGTSNLATAAILWAKDYTHLIGLCSGGPEPRSRVKSPVALASTPFITWSADGCIAKNISFWHESTNAASLVNVLVSGGRNLFEDCQFAGGIGTNNASGARSLKLSTADASGNVFRRCWIGNDTITAVAGNYPLEFAGGAMHTVFDDCVFALTAGATTTVHVACTAAADVGRFNQFKGCLFINEDPATVQASVFGIGGGNLDPSNRIIMRDCWQYGVAKWDSNNRGVITNITIAANTTGVNTGNTLIITSA